VSARLAIVAAISVLSLGLSVGCASVPLKERVTQGVGVVHTSVNAAQSAEIAVWESKVLAGSWTEANRRAFHSALVRYYDAEVKVTGVLLTWRAGDPVPTELVQQLRVANEALAEAIKLSPSNGFRSVLENVQMAVRGLVDLLNIVGGQS
jgi:hypothetical protein